MCKQLRRAETSGDHGLRVLSTSDIAALNFIGMNCIILRLFAALGAFVGIYDMPADMIIRGSVDKLVISLFLAYLLHLSTAVLAYRMPFLMLDFLNSQCFHPVIVSTLCSALMLRNVTVSGFGCT